MKTTIELPDPLLRQAKAAAAARGESLRELVASALRGHLARPAAGGGGPEGWRKVFDKARPVEIAAVDAAIAEAFERIDPADWR